MDKNQSVQDKKEIYNLLIKSILSDYEQKIEEDNKRRQVLKDLLELKIKGKSLTMSRQ